MSFREWGAKCRRYALPPSPNVRGTDERGKVVQWQIIATSRNLAFRLPGKYCERDWIGGKGVGVVAIPEGIR